MVRKTLSQRFGIANVKFLRTRRGKEIAAKYQDKPDSVLKGQLTRTRNRAGFVSRPKPKDVGNGWKERRFATQDEAIRYSKHLRKDARVRVIAEGIPTKRYESDPEGERQWRTVLGNMRRADMPDPSQPRDTRYEESPEWRTDYLADISAWVVRFHA